MKNIYTRKNPSYSKTSVHPVHLSTEGSEIQLQAQCFQWAWNNYPETRRCLAAVPNGGSRNKIEAMQLKASGVLAGVHDLFFYWKGQLYWFELKVGENKQTKEQIEFGKAMTAQGAVCVEIRSFGQFQEEFLKALGTSVKSTNFFDAIDGI